MRKSPAAPLPWATAKVGGEMRISSAEGARIGALHYDGRIQHDAQRANAEYLVHAANLLPKALSVLALMREQADRVVTYPYSKAKRDELAHLSTVVQEFLQRIDRGGSE